jgi:hypothetical protein
MVVILQLDISYRAIGLLKSHEVNDKGRAGDEEDLHQGVV